MSLKCYYCARSGHPTLPGKPKDVVANITFHDGRGCVHVCPAHAQWRLTTSMMLTSHSPDCPYFMPERV